MENKEYWIEKYKNIKDNLDLYLNDIEEIVINSKDEYILEGNLFYYHGSLLKCDNNLPKQINLFWIGSLINKKILEIGFNAGHSALLFILGHDNTYIDFTIFDIGVHPYVKPCIDYLSSRFNNINFEYIEGDSIIEIPKWINKNNHLLEQYDIIHIDGGHMYECINNDIINTIKLIKIGGIIIIDDSQDHIINECVNKHFNNNDNFKEEFNIVPLHFSSQHRFIRRIK